MRAVNSCLLSVILYCYTPPSLANPIYIELIGLEGQHLVVWYDPYLPGVSNGELEMEWERYSDAAFELSRLAGFGCSRAAPVDMGSNQPFVGLRVGSANGRDYSVLELGSITLSSDQLIGRWETGDRLIAIERSAVGVSTE